MLTKEIVYYALTTLKCLLVTLFNICWFIAAIGVILKVLGGL